ncbi:MAG: hypothetical protein JST36_02565 [Bacteroidetes bacterium]|nr:hypothetical protein [Bacteroidota bacterium]
MRLLKKIPLLLAALLCTITLSAQTKKYRVDALTEVQVQHRPGAGTIQVVQMGQEPIELDLTQPGTNTFQIKTADYNFDGFKDFAFVSTDPATGSQAYDIFLFYPEDRSFESLEAPPGVCEGWNNVRLSIADKTLKNTCKTGGKTSSDLFKWTSQFSLEHLKSTDNTQEAQQERTAQKAELKADKQEEKAEQKQQQQDRRQDRRERQKEQHTEDDED